MNKFHIVTLSSLAILFAAVLISVVYDPSSFFVQLPKGTIMGVIAAAILINLFNVIFPVYLHFKNKG
jgi:hypothetical protein